MDTGLAIRFGLLLGGLVVVWQLTSATLLGATSLFVPVAAGLECAVLLVLFMRPAAGRPMGPRIATGSAVALLGALIAFGGSLLCSLVLFPDLLASLPGQPSALEAASGGFMGTLVTGIALSAALAFLQRQREG